MSIASVFANSPTISSLLEEEFRFYRFSELNSRYPVLVNLKRGAEDNKRLLRNQDIQKTYGKVASVWGDRNYLMQNRIFKIAKL